jgi:hypothetical protein
VPKALADLGNAERRWIIEIVLEFILLKSNIVVGFLIGFSPLPTSSQAERVKYL